MKKQKNMYSEKSKGGGKDSKSSGRVQVKDCLEVKDMGLPKSKNVKYGE